MRTPEKLFRLLLGMGLALATTAPAFAAPIFGAANNLRISACPSNPNTPGGSLNATPVNGGAGVILSGSASVTANHTLCMQLEWGGSMSGSVDAVADVPIAWDVLTSVTDLTEPVVSTDIYIEVSHEPYLVGTFNQGGYADGTSRSRPRPVHVACQPAHDLVRPSPGNATQLHLLLRPNARALREPMIPPSRPSRYTSPRRRPSIPRLPPGRRCSGTRHLGPPRRRLGRHRVAPSGRDLDSTWAARAPTAEPLRPFFPLTAIPRVSGRTQRASTRGGARPARRGGTERGSCVACLVFGWRC